MHSDEFRRHSDGSIDFDFYRRSAAQLRCLAWRDAAARLGGRGIAAAGLSLLAALFVAALSLPAAKRTSAAYAGAATTQTK